jgi:hypothetical protein
MRSLSRTYTQRGNAYTACLRSFSTSISLPAMPPEALGARVSRESRSVAVAPTHPAAAAKRAMTGNKKMATSICDSPPWSAKMLANKKIHDQMTSHERTPVASVVHNAAETTPGVTVAFACDERHLGETRIEEETGVQLRLYHLYGMLGGVVAVALHTMLAMVVT